MLDLLEINSVDKIRKQKLGNLLKDIHSQIPKQPIDFTQVGYFEIKGGFLNGKKIKRLIIYMRSFGCEWMLTDENGGCTMCGHLAGTARGEAISAKSYIKQFDNIISDVNLDNIPMICIYNAGSFFNDKEMPPLAREYIYLKLASIESIESIIFESRPEYINSDKIKKMRAIIPKKRIEIGIGLESSNEYIRQVCLNKGFRIEEFQNVIHVLKEYDIHLLAYISQKPPFVNEKLAIDDTIASINWAFKNGVDVISIEPISVQKNTLVHLLYNMNLYRPPWIWSVMSVVKGVGEKGLIRIGGFEFFPPPDICTHNCPSCNDICIDAIASYNATNDISIVEEALKRPCAKCKDTWIEDLKVNISIQDNIDSFLNNYNKEALNELLRAKLRSYP